MSKEGSSQVVAARGMGVAYLCCCNRRKRLEAEDVETPIGAYSD